MVEPLVRLPVVAVRAPQTVLTRRLAFAERVPVAD